MGSINSFCQAVQEILLNNYLKKQFWKLGVYRFYSFPLEFYLDSIKEKPSFQKSHLFFKPYMQISWELLMIER